MSHNYSSNAFEYIQETCTVKVAAGSNGKVDNILNALAAAGITANANGKGPSQSVQHEQTKQLAGVEVPSLAVHGVTAANATYSNSALSEGNEVGGRSA